MTIRFDSGMTPEEEAWVRSLPRRQRLALLALDVTLQLAVVGGFLWFVLAHSWAR